MLEQLLSIVICVFPCCLCNGILLVYSAFFCLCQVGFRGCYRTLRHRSHPLHLASSGDSARCSCPKCRRRMSLILYVFIISDITCVWAFPGLRWKLHLIIVPKLGFILEGFPSYASLFGYIPSTLYIYLYFSLSTVEYRIAVTSLLADCYDCSLNAVFV